MIWFLSTNMGFPNGRMRGTCKGDRILDVTLVTIIVHRIVEKFEGLGANVEP